MAKKKSRPQDPTGGRRARSSPLLWRLRYFILLIAAGGLLYWQLTTPDSWLKNLGFNTGFGVRATLDNIGNAFGWGLIFVIVSVLAIFWVFQQRKMELIIKRGNIWIGAIALMMAAWGIFGFISVKLGGSIGMSIIVNRDFLGILRILGLVLIGVILVAPTSFFKLLVIFGKWLFSLFKRKPKSEIPYEAPSATEQVIPPYQARGKQLASQPVVNPFPSTVAGPAERPVAKEKLVSAEKAETKKKKAPAPSQLELKETAQDVWKKLGESPSGAVVDGWRLPPIDLLEKSPEVQLSPADNQERAKRIVEALDSYGVEAKVVEINAGPTVTQFGVEPGWDRKTREVKVKDKDGKVTTRTEEISKTRVKVDRITSLANDLALALAAPSIRIEAPVPGKALVGIEVPNTVLSNVSLRGVIETSVFQKMLAKASLAVALGKGAGGEAVAADLAKMPHLLIAGSTGSGKTVCLNAIICCLLLNNTPADLRFIMIDPKRVELTNFKGVQHLAEPVIVEPDKAVLALRGLSIEMNNRYKIMADAGTRNIEGYNKNRKGYDKMPFLVLIIDELADLMMTGGAEVEQNLCRLAQLSRAVGIHLVVATQRPSVDVVTGLIKANFPTRISFAVTSQVDSRTILDMVGAEKLLGRGDMLYMPTEAAKPKRLQGCYVSDAEVERLVYIWGNQGNYDEVPLLRISELASSSVTKDGYPEDALLEEAKQLAAEHENISTSFLQRRLHIGYPRAARLYDQLKEALGTDEDVDEDEELDDEPGEDGEGEN